MCFEDSSSNGYEGVGAAVADSVEQHVSAAKVAPAKKATGKAEITLHLKPFTVEASLADNHVCGGYDGEFQASCDLVADSLDSSGFVTDNLGFIELVKQAFSATMLKASCEELALGIVNLACSTVGSRLARASVQVFNLTGSANVSWVKGDGVPPFPREATRQERRDTERARERGEEPRGC